MSCPTNTATTHLKGPDDVLVHRLKTTAPIPKGTVIWSSDSDVVVSPSIAGNHALEFLAALRSGMTSRTWSNFAEEIRTMPMATARSIANSACAPGDVCVLSPGAQRKVAFFAKSAVQLHGWQSWDAVVPGVSDDSTITNVQADESVAAKRAFRSAGAGAGSSAPRKVLRNKRSVSTLRVQGLCPVMGAVVAIHPILCMLCQSDSIEMKRAMKDLRRTENATGLVIPPNVCVVAYMDLVPGPDGGAPTGWRPVIEICALRDIPAEYPLIVDRMSNDLETANVVGRRLIGAETRRAANVSRWVAEAQARGVSPAYITALRMNVFTGLPGGVGADAYPTAYTHIHNGATAASLAKDAASRGLELCMKFLRTLGEAMLPATMWDASLAPAAKLQFLMDNLDSMEGNPDLPRFLRHHTQAILTALSGASREAVEATPFRALLDVDLISDATGVPQGMHAAALAAVAACGDGPVPPDDAARLATIEASLASSRQVEAVAKFRAIAAATINSIMVRMNVSSFSLALLPDGDAMTSFTPFTDRAQWKKAAATNTGVLTDDPTRAAMVTMAGL